MKFKSALKIVYQTIDGWDENFYHYYSFSQILYRFSFTHLLKTSQELGNTLRLVPEAIVSILRTSPPSHQFKLLFHSKLQNSLGY